MATKKSVYQNFDQSQELYFIDCLTDAIRNGTVDSVKYFDDRYLSLMVDNYQIDVAQTDVFYYKNWIHRALDIGEWRFVPGELERYSLTVFENKYPLRWQGHQDLYLNYEMGSDGIWRRRYNVAIMKAAMASDQGRYIGQCIAREAPVEMFYHENKPFFEPLKKLWHVATEKFSDTALMENNLHNHDTRYDLPCNRTRKDLYLLRKRVLAALKNQKVK